MTGIRPKLPPNPTLPVEERMAHWWQVMTTRERCGLSVLADVHLPVGNPSWWYMEPETRRKIIGALKSASMVCEMIHHEYQPQFVEDFERQPVRGAA